MLKKFKESEFEEQIFDNENNKIIDINFNLKLELAHIRLL